jgi:Sporulation and spore germination
VVRARLRPRRALVVLAGLAVVATGCAIPVQSRPSAVPADHVPFGLLNPSPSTTTTTEPNLSALVPVKVYLISPTQQLQAANRVVVSPAPVTAVLDSLLAGPTSSEAERGTTTAIPTDVTVLSAQTSGSVVTVNFNETFGEITGASTELAVSQVVATVAALNGSTTGVSFEIEGQPTNVPIASGAEVPGPVYVLQFLNLPTSPTTTTTSTTTTP